MIYGSVCSGIEAATVAWHPLGWTPAWFSEIEKFPCAVLQRHYPEIPNLGDMTKLYVDKTFQDRPIDLLVGGTPCQSFSIAGLRKGLDDPRGNLCLEFLRLVDRKRPRWFVWENVPGVLSSSGGRDFGSFIAAIQKLGYGFCWRILDAQYFGVPQHRRRVFVVGYLGNWHYPGAVLFERESLHRDITSGGKKKETITERASDSAASNGSWWDGGQVNQTLDAVLAKGQMMPEKNRFPVVLVPQCITGDKTHALKADGFDGSEDGTGRGQPIIAFNHQENHAFKATTATNPLRRNQTEAVCYSQRVRRLTPVECERLQGFPDNYTLLDVKKPADGPRYKALGNSMAVPCMRWIGRRIQMVDGIIRGNV